MTSPNAGAPRKRETVQEIVEELLAATRLDSETKTNYRQRVGLALLMEAVETMRLTEEGRTRDDG